MIGTEKHCANGRNNTWGIIILEKNDFSRYLDITRVVQGCYQADPVTLLLAVVRKERTLYEE
jgi:hypothetical protein